VQSQFEILCVAFAAVAVGTHAERMMFAGESLKAFTLPALGLMLLHTVLYLGPLLVFGPTLLAVKRRGLREYGAMATAYARSSTPSGSGAGLRPANRSGAATSSR
jgi:hypothetical protein